MAEDNELNAEITIALLEEMGFSVDHAEDGFPFLYISDRFPDILGWTRKEICEQFDNKFVNLVHPDDRKLLRVYGENTDPAEQKDKYQDQMYRLRGKHGYRWVTDSSLKTEVNGKTVFHGSISDVTRFIEERERKEEELKKALELAETQTKKADSYAEQLKSTAEKENRRLEDERNNAVSANETKSRFLSSISHDIRTPINGIQGMLRIADRYPNDVKKQKECRDKMWIASDYLVSLVNNVLDMNRLENKAVDLSEQPFDLIEVLMNLTTMAEMQTKAQGLRTIVDWKPGYISHRYLIGSAEGLSRILMNLNSNAIKYNKKGGSIYCRCMETGCDGDTVWFELINSDTGIGMDEEFLKHAFDAYSQKNNTTLNSINGVGLGLSIVKQTVELMGGTLKIESKVNEGTKYIIMLPFKIDPHPVEDVRNMEHVSLKGVKALLVEDNDLNTEIAKFHLEEENIRVYTASDGQEAVKVFEESEEGFFDIILMDIMMPVMNGLDAARKIRSLNRPDALAVPIIAMSANAFEEDIQKSLEAGMNAHLTKPLDGKKVISTIKKYLANKILK